MNGWVVTIRRMRCTSDTNQENVNHLSIRIGSYLWLWSEVMQFNKPAYTLKRSVDCTNAGHEDMRTIASVIQLNTNLEDLSLDGGFIAIDIALDLGSAMRENKTIRKLKQTTLVEI